MSDDDIFSLAIDEPELDVLSLLRLAGDAWAQFWHGPKALAPARIGIPLMLDTYTVVWIDQDDGSEHRSEYVTWLTMIEPCKSADAYGGKCTRAKGHDGAHHRRASNGIVRSWL